MPDWRRLLRERLELPELEGRGEERIYGEMADHLEQLYEEAIARGDSEAEAAARVIEQLGDGRASAEELVSSGRYRLRSAIECAQDDLEVSLGERGGVWLLLSDLMRDLRHGLRSLRRSPGFVTVALVTCALGIGSSTAIFSILSAVLFEPFPFPEPDRLVTIWTPEIGYEGVPMSAPDYHDYRRSSQVFAAWGAYTEGRVNLTEGDTPERLTAFRCSPGILQAIGVKPAIGRLFTAADEQDGDSRLVVLSHRLWQRRFAADPEIVGTTILLNSEPYSVVGVLPPEFRIPAWRRLDDADLYPLLVVPEEASRGNQYLLTIGRLREGATIEQADQELNIIASRLAKEYPESNHRRVVSIVPLRDIVLGDSGQWLWMLMAAVGFVLLIACSNVAGLLLARGTARSGELAIRSALGAGRGRIIRQLLVEGCLLSTLGGIVGLIIAWWGVGLLRGLIPTALPRVAEMRVDGMVLLFCLGISLATGILFGLAPALETLRVNLGQAMRESRRTYEVGRRKSRFLAVLVVVQFALALVLVNGAASMLKSLWNVTGSRELQEPEEVLIAGLSLDGPRYLETTVRKSVMDRLFERLRALPGVEAVGATSRLPLTSGWAGGVLVGGEEYDPETERPLTWFVGARGDYLEAMGIRVVRGRALRPGDGQGEIPSAVANVVVNQTFAERYWPGVDPIGKQVRGNFEPPWFVGTVVGVVEDVRQNGLESGVDREVYLPFLPGFMPDRWIVIRATGDDPTVLTSSLRHELAAIDPGLPLSSVMTGDELYDSSAGSRRFSTLLFSLFAVVALYLIGAGAYGVLAFDVVRRKHEIGIRGALGASIDSIVKLVLSRGLRLALVGVMLGLVGAVVSSQLLQSLLFQVSPLNPISLGLAVAFLVTVGLLASVVPALRAAAVDPVRTLQSE